MWTEGTLRINGKNISYWIKYYDLPSEDYGVDGGRVSKIQLRLDGEAILLNYDRGWDIFPKDEDAKTALQYLLKKYN